MTGRSALTLTLVAASIIATPSPADVFPLYVGNGTETPADQNWISAGVGDATQSALDGVTTLSTMADYQIQAGYSRWPLLPALNRVDGYTITFDIRLDAEDHTSNDRAGFSVIVLSDGDSHGIELGFWSDRIWAQASGFTQAEMVVHDTESAITHYGLTVLENQYHLYAGGRQILTGPLRYYGGALAYPYSLKNFLFIGDDTSSARAQVSITRVELRNGSDLIRAEDQLRLPSSWKYKIWQMN